MDITHDTLPSINNLKDEDLIGLYNGFERKVEILELENQVFESHWNRVAPSSASSKAETNQEPLEKGEQQSAIVKNLVKKKRGERTKDNEAVVLLSPEQKFEVANKEVEESKDKIEKEKEKWVKITDGLKAEIEEIEGRIGEIIKNINEFKKEIMTQSRNPRSNKIIAEKLIKYCEDAIKLKESTIEKIRLKNSTLKVQRLKLQTQLRQKEEMGEVLHAIDFDQLKIENQQYLGKIEEQNAELLKLKMSSGNATQSLNHLKVRTKHPCEGKKQLAEMTLESDSLNKDIIQRKELLERLDEELGSVNLSLGAANTAHTQLKSQIEQVRVPDVMEYVLEKATEGDLRLKVRNWQRKVDVARMSLTREKSILKKLRNQEKTSK